MIYAASAISIDFSQEVEGRHSEQSQAAQQFLHNQVCQALEGASLYDLAQPGVRQVLAQYKYLLLSLNQRALFSEHEGPGLHRLAGPLLVSELFWEDGLQHLSTTLQQLAANDDSSASITGHVCPPTRALVTIDSMDQLLWWCSYKHTDPSSVTFSKIAAVPVQDLLTELGMPMHAAIKSQMQLQGEGLQHVMEASLPLFRQQVLSYLRSQFGLPNLICAQPLHQDRPNPIPVWQPGPWEPELLQSIIIEGCPTELPTVSEEFSRISCQISRATVSGRGVQLGYLMVTTMQASQDASGTFNPWTLWRSARARAAAQAPPISSTMIYSFQEQQAEHAHANEVIIMQLGCHTT